MSDEAAMIARLHESMDALGISLVREPHESWYDSCSFAYNGIPIPEKHALAVLCSRAHQLCSVNHRYKFPYVHYVTPEEATSSPGWSCEVNGKHTNDLYSTFEEAVVTMVEALAREYGRPCASTVQSKEDQELFSCIGGFAETSKTSAVSARGMPVGPAAGIIACGTIRLFDQLEALKQRVAELEGNR